jgi:hypothetical protein
MKTEHAIDWRKTANEIQADYEAVCQQRDEAQRERDEALRQVARMREALESLDGQMIVRKHEMIITRSLSEIPSPGVLCESEPVAYYTNQGNWPRIALAVDGNHDGYETPLYRKQEE